MESFDVIVAGGGGAGCVVAARLAESSSRSVLLLEAGPDRRARPPEGFRDGWGLPQEFDWGYVSEPKPDGEVQRCRRIKLLGGTSWLTRFAPRGSPADYDGWAARGCTGWGFDDVLPYFLRLETDDDFGDQAWHGDSGPMPVKRYFDVEYTEPAAAALSAMLAAGFPPVDDHNRPGAVGAGRMPMSSREGERVTTADAYLPPGGAPANLTIRLGRPLRRHLRQPLASAALRHRSGRAPARARDSGAHRPAGSGSQSDRPHRRGVRHGLPRAEPGGSWAPPDDELPQLDGRKR